MLVSVAHVKLVNAFAMYCAGLNEGRVRTGNIDVLLGFRCCAEFAEEQRMLSITCRPFSKVDGMRHPIINVFGSSPSLSSRGTLSFR
jgi:hypothetical protein